MLRPLPLLAAAALLLTSFSAAAATASEGPAAPRYDDADALKGQKTGKGVFLVNIGEAQKLARYLKVIHGSHQGMAEQKVTPDFVVVFVGPGVQFLTTTPSAEVAGSPALKDVANTVEALRAAGIRMEICSVATAAMGVDNAKVLPGIKVVRDGFVSAIGYQAQGYGLVPVN
ncbi:DsrE family protein [Vulgatibacter incomptus]|uniref:Uncharacterized protein n=1 Tax=Vulgatibacter incomptus TaxID=1391653 RepID=A0A0K1PGL2_9BACT|nr:DsrE family protein [Vulgatibacter incomptus]AKU92660.1 hypothetical protein AKJ08_3047 [Vulgatibacter incomptus]